MDALAEFVHMGGYAFFVWTSYAIVALLLALNLWLAVRRDRDLRRRLRRMLSTSGTDTQRAHDGPARRRRSP